MTLRHAAAGAMLALVADCTGSTDAGTPVSPEAVPSDIVALTNEPFLSASIKDGRVTVDGVGVAARTLDVTERLEAGGARRWSGRDEAGEVSVEARPLACEDSMSGARYPYAVVVTVDAVVGRGCGRPYDMPPPPVPD